MLHSKTTRYGKNMKKYRKPDTIDFYIKDINNKTRYSVDAQMKQYDVTHPQGKMLGMIYGANKQGLKITRKYLQEKSGISGPSVSSLLDGLEKKKFIIRSVNDEDGRALNVAVTKKGEKLVEEIHCIFRESEAKLVKDMTAEEKKTFKSLLKRAHSNLLD